MAEDTTATIPPATRCTASAGRMGTRSLRQHGVAHAPRHVRTRCTTAHGGNHAHASAHSHAPRTTIQSDGSRTSLVVALSTRAVQFPRGVRRDRPDRGATGRPGARTPDRACWAESRFEALVVRPIFNSLFRFESAARPDARVGAYVGRQGCHRIRCQRQWIDSLELGGEVVQVLGTQLARTASLAFESEPVISVRIEEVDSTRNRCTVSRIGLGEAESTDADR